MRDLISRQAAISICDNAIDLWNGQLGTGALVAVRDAIMALPSAQPVAKDINVPAKDCISRQWLMECVDEGWIKFDTQEDENRFVHLIRDIAPSAQSTMGQVNQGDTISRQAAIDAIDRAVTKEAARWSLQELPSAERRGRWEDVEHAPNGLLYATCSVCGKRQTVECTNYCGNCGARMEEDA